jgi:hypothetical protein
MVTRQLRNVRTRGCARLLGVDAGHSWLSVVVVVQVHEQHLTKHVNTIASEIHMRISVPTIPLLSTRLPAPHRSVQEAVERVANFLSTGNVAILTGAGVSVDSGIRA